MTGYGALATIRVAGTDLLDGANLGETKLVAVVVFDLKLTRAPRSGCDWLCELNRSRREIGEGHLDIGYPNIRCPARRVFDWTGVLLQHDRGAIATHESKSRIDHIDMKPEDIAIVTYRLCDIGNGYKWRNPGAERS